MLHPYIGLKATIKGQPERTGIIVYVGIQSEECNGYALHDCGVTLLMPDGTHDGRWLSAVTVDPLEASARLSELG